jgi:hypothetical protein
MKNRDIIPEPKPQKKADKSGFASGSSNECRSDLDIAAHITGDVTKLTGKKEDHDVDEVPHMPNHKCHTVELRRPS